MPYPICDPMLTRAIAHPRFAILRVAAFESAPDSVCVLWGPAETIEPMPYGKPVTGRCAFVPKPG